MKQSETMYVKITISVPREVVGEVDRIAKCERRNRSGQMTFFCNQFISHNGAQSHNKVISEEG